MDANIDTAIIVSTASDEAPNVRPLTAFAEAINSAWRKGAACFIACGKLLTEAKEQHPRDAFNAMIKSKLDFDPSVGRKLILIASNDILCAPGHKLPPNWTILY